MRLTALTCLIVTLCLPATAQDGPAPPDLMTFAQGALPIAIGGAGPAMRMGMEQAIAMIDGNGQSRSATPKPGAATDVVDIVFALPAPTQFTRFAIPNITETPSPSQTFFADVEVLGASQSAEGPFVPLARRRLSLGAMNELTMVPDGPAVSWVKLRLSGGVSVERDQTYFEFSELIGNGSQQMPPLDTGFNGVWKGRGVNIELAQEGATVTGCYDRENKLTGTVQGNILRALGADPAGVPSHFILMIGPDGGLRGLRSSNGAPFRPFDGAVSGNAPRCLAPAPASLGCGAVVHGIGFDFDSDTIRADSAPILDAIFAGLSVASGSVEIVGHSSSEGGAAYNRDLSQRRAASVVRALVARGLQDARLTSIGLGEDVPIASNDDEAGRSLNRRVELRCAG